MNNKNSFFNEGTNINLPRTPGRLKDTSIYNTPLSKIDSMNDQQREECLLVIPKTDQEHPFNVFLNKNLHFTKTDILFEELYKHFSPSENINIDLKLMQSCFDND